MEKFVIADNLEGHRAYDFKGRLEGEAKEAIEAARKAGRLVLVSPLTKLFGPAKWSGLGENQVRIIDALVQEVTRTGARRGSNSRPDAASITTGNQVVGSTAKQRVACPLLCVNARYVAFGGNGRRRGMGYLLIGHKNSGWLDKCGYDVSNDDRPVKQVLRKFLQDLSEVSQLLGLIVVGYLSAGSLWFSLSDMIAMARSPVGRRRLKRISVRIYGPEDYQRRLRRHLEDRGGFSEIPGEIVKAPDVGTGGVLPQQLDVGARRRRLGITQTHFAQQLRCSQPFLSQLENEERPWPAELQAAAERILDSAENGIPVG